MAQPNPNNPRPGNNPGNVMRPTPRTLPTPSSNAATTTTTRTATVKTKGPVRPFLFDKSNYRIMIGGVALILLGLFLMAGGKSQNPHVFRYDEIFSFRRVTLAPVIMMIGFCLQIYAIMKKPAAVNVVMSEA